MAQEAAQRGDIDALYAEIRRDAHLLDEIDRATFVHTPLHVATAEGHIDFVMEMMNLKPSFARKLNQGGFSPMHMAMQNNHAHVVRSLLKVDKDLVRVKGRGALTPLHLAAQQDNVDLLAEFLVSCPECIMDVDIRGETALHVAVRANMLRSLRLLARWLRRTSHKDGDIWEKQVLNCKNREGYTALHLAAAINHHQMIRVLLECNVDRNEINSNGWTALDILEAHDDNRETINILRRAGGLNAAALPNRPTLVDFLSSDMSVTEILDRAVVRQRKNISNETRNALPVVAGLILTATYQACLQPPGGLSQGGSNGSSDSTTSSSQSIFSPPPPVTGLTAGNVGQSVMEPSVFLLFFGINTAAFFTTAIVTLHFLLVGPIKIMSLLSIPMALLLVCCVVSTFVISPTRGYIAIFGVFGLLTYPTRRWLSRRSRLANYLVKKYRYRNYQDGYAWGIY